MFESFPPKKSGDTLEADYVTRMGMVCGRMGKLHSSGSIHLQNTGSAASIAGIFPNHIYSMIVVEQDSEDENLYTVKRRWYNHEDEEWDDDDNEWLLDASELNQDLAEDDKITAFWNEQRGMFIPTFGVPSYKRWGQLTTRVSYLGSAVVLLWETSTGTPTGWYQSSGEGVTALLPPTCYGLPGPSDVSLGGSGIFVSVLKIGDTYVIEEPHNIRIAGYAYDDVEKTDTTFQIDTVVTLQGPLISNSAGSLFTIYNAFSWEIDKDGRVDAIWNGNAGRWDAVQALCP